MEWIYLQLQLPAGHSQDEQLQEVQVSPMLIRGLMVGRLRSVLLIVGNKIQVTSFYPTKCDDLVQLLKSNITGILSEALTAKH